ncbi:MAG: hypothetical protein HZB16_17960 [Armatimonadetes bacterium]|nr:hypothetical protein [Armatimonadota bacterium]
MHAVTRHLCLCLALLSMAGSARAADELLANPGFEAAGGGWSENAWGQPGPAFTYADGAAPHGGRRCQLVRVTALPPGSGFIYRQPYTLVAGHTYRARLWLRSPDHAQVQVMLRRAGQWYEPAAARLVELGPEWREVALVGGFGGEDTLGFLGVSWRRPGTVELDDASLTDITAETLSLPTPTAPVDQRFFGLHINKLGSHNTWPALGQATLRLWDTGTTWDALEPKPGEWNFGRLDYYVEHVRRNAPGTRVVMTLGITPNWAAEAGARGAYGGKAAPPTDPATWRRYVRTLAERYRGRIHCWEPWNECDYGGFFNGGPAAMLPLARIAYEELKAVDPRNTVLTPNVTRAGLGWLDEYLALGGGQYADVISFHRYPSGRPELDVPEYHAVRDLAAAHGLADKPVWNTEGAIEHRAGTTEDEQVGAVVRTWLVQWAQGITCFAWYCWDIHWPEGTSLGTSLTGPELSPAGRALARLVAWVDGWTMTSRAVTDGLWRLTLTRDGARRTIVWRPTGTAPWLPPADLGRCVATDLRGVEQPIGPDGLLVGPFPLLLTAR